MKLLASLMIVIATATTAFAGARDFRFSSIDGGALEMSDWDGKPVLVVNTASQCGFTGQYAGLQSLWERYRDEGLVVLAVPSDDFNQELGSAEEVKEFCELNYGLDLPMTDITQVRGSEAHPFYRAVRDQTGFEPRWNFNKVLVAPDGSVAGTWGSNTQPLSREITKAVEALLPGA